MYITLCLLGAPPCVCWVHRLASAGCAALCLLGAAAGRCPPFPFAYPWCPPGAPSSPLLPTMHPPPIAPEVSNPSPPLPPLPAVPTERDLWQQPVRALAISERGRAQAAEEQLKAQLLRMRQRGCKEEFVPDPELMAVGEVDFLPAAKLDEAALARQKEAAELEAKATR